MIKRVPEEGETVFHVVAIQIGTFMNKKVWGLYVFDPESRTYCAELTASRLLHLAHIECPGLTDEEDNEMRGVIWDDIVVVYMWAFRVDEMKYEKVIAETIEEACEGVCANCGFFASVIPSEEVPASVSA